MKKLFFFLIASLLLSAPLAISQEVSAFEKANNMLNQAPYVDQEIIVKFKEAGISTLSVATSEMEKLPIEGSCYRVKVSDNIQASLESILQDPNVEYAEPNYIVHTQKTPNDPDFGRLAGMKNIKAPKAWDVRVDASSIVVCVIDTGVDYNHEDLQANMWVNEEEKNGQPGVDDDDNGVIDDIHGFNGINNSGDPLDDNNHGSHCAGTIAGVGDNGVGVAGVCWKAQVMACKFLSGSGSGSTADAIKCIDYAVANGAKVLSNSWGGGGFSAALYESIKKAGQAGVLFVAAAGNNGSSTLSFPAKYCENNSVNGTNFPALKNVLAVAASDGNDQRASFSQFSLVSIKANNLVAAPGTNVLSTVIGNSYASFNGTSMATPHVAGAATLTWAQKPNLKVNRLKKLLVRRGNKVQWQENGTTITVRRLNVAKLLKREE